MNLNDYKNAKIINSLSLDIPSSASPFMLPDKIALVAAGDWLVSNHNYLNTMVDARDRNSEMFFSQFIGSVASLKKYLLQGPLSQPNHILFLLIDGTGHFFGHVGLKYDFTRGFEVDNVMKFSLDEKGLMSAAIKTLLVWIKDELDVDSVYLKVISTNVRAIRMYTQLGFVLRKSYYLMESNLVNSLTILEPCALEDSNTSEKMYVLHLDFN